MSYVVFVRYVNHKVCLLRSARPCVLIEPICQEGERNVLLSHSFVPGLGFVLFEELLFIIDCDGRYSGFWFGVDNVCEIFGEIV